MRPENVSIHGWMVLAEQATGLFQFDFVGWLLGGSSSIWSRIVFTVVGIAAVCGIPGLFTDDDIE